MKRRDFLAASAALIASGGRLVRGEPNASPETTQRGPGYATPQDAQRAPRESLLYCVGIYTGTPVERPDYLATIDTDPASSTYGQVIHRLEMPHVGDELHHFGWNVCSSCHGDATRERRFLIVPGLASSRLHIIDVGDPRRPTLHRVIEPEEIAEKTNLSAPHTVHCLADGRVMISMLGDAAGRAPGGFLLLDEEFRVAGRWESGAPAMRFNYDFWYQPRHNVMVSSEWAAPQTFRGGFNPEHVQQGKYGRRLNFWDWSKRRIVRSVDLGEDGLIPLEVRFHHDPQSTHGFVGAALSSAIWHWSRSEGRWQVENVVQLDPVEVQGWPFPVPALISDLLISMDDRFLYFSSWLHGDIRQYDISDPSAPRLTGQVNCGGVLRPAPKMGDHTLEGGPQMLQLSLDGKRLYVTNSLYSTWDNQFYPRIAEKGSYMLMVDCDTEQGGLSLNEEFFVDFGAEPHGPARAHEMRLLGGDCTSDIFV